MSEEPTFEEPPKSHVREYLIVIAVAIGAFAAGILLESHLAAQAAAAVAQTHEAALKQVTDKAEQEKRNLTDSLAKEREDHAKDIQTKDQHLAAFSSRAAGMRHDLEAGLSAARSSGAACTARIAGISEALGGVFESIGEVTGIAQDLGRENQQLKEDNKSLSDKLTGWQKWNAEQNQRIIINGKKVN